MRSWKSRFALLLCLAVLLCIAPTLAEQAFSGGSGTRNDPYLLSTAADLRRMRERLAMDAAFANGAPYFRLTNDIRLNQGLGEAFNWRPVARFGGDFDGAGFTVTGMYVPVDNAVRLEGSGALGGGFIGELAAGGRVHNLTLSGCVEAPTGGTRALVGGLVCDNRGEVADCVSYVTITVTRAIAHLQSSGIAATSTGKLLRCTDRSRFYIYPEALDDAGELSYSGLVGDPAGMDTGETDACVDESQYIGAEYPAVWNLYEPSPRPSSSAAPPSSSPVPAPETLAAQSMAVSPAPSPSVVAAGTPKTTATRDPAQVALAEMQNAVSAVGSLFAQDVRTEGDYRYTLSADGQHVAVLAYTGAGGRVTVPDTLAGLAVTRIGASAFAGQQTLLELSLPDSVTVIADDALVGCRNLYRLHLPAALEILPLSALHGCERLVYIDMPAQVTTITGRFPLESAAVTAWDNGNPKAAAYAAAHDLTVRCGAYRDILSESTDGITIRFRPSDPDTVRALYASELGQKAGTEANIDFSLTGFAWRDAYFAPASGLYNHGLAQMSMGLSVAAFRSTDGVSGDGFRDQNALRVLLDCGFGNIRTDGYAVGDEAGVGSAIASKQITVEGQPITLVVVAASGAGYGAEWLNNLNVCHTDPASPEHNGFASAADTLLARLNTYLSENRIAGTRWKLWLTGFGRAAAVCDLLAERCQNTLLPTEDCYAYLFATPGVGKATEAQAQRGVWNIVNPCDLFAALPPAGWGYARYGQTLLLPSWRAKDAQGYLTEFDAMLAAAQAILTVVPSDSALFPFLRLRGEGDRRLIGAYRFIGALAAFVMPSAPLYDAQFYQSLRALWQGNRSETQNMALALRAIFSGPLLQLAQRAPNLSLVGVLDGCYRSQALANARSAAEALLASTADKAAYPTIRSALRGEASEDAILTYAEIERFVVPALNDAASLLVSMHSPELYLAWMMSLSEGDLAPAAP